MREEMWSVQTELNGWTDDFFNGTYDECVEYCIKQEIKIDGVKGRLARILVEDGCSVEDLEYVDEL